MIVKRPKRPDPVGVAVLVGAIVALGPGGRVASGDGIADLSPPEEPGAAVEVAIEPRPGGLRGAEVMRRARERAPRLQVGRAEVAVTDARVSRTMSRFVPSLAVTGGVVRQSAIPIDFGGAVAQVGALNAGPIRVAPCADGSGECVVDSAGVPVGAFASEAFVMPRTAYRVEATLSVPISTYALSLLAARDSARTEKKAARWRLKAETAQVESQALLAYLDWLGAQAQVAVARESLERARARVVDAQLGLAAGTLTETDVLQMNSLVARAERSALQASSFEIVAREALAQWVGMPADAVVAGESLDEALTAGALPPVEEAVSHGREHRPELLALRAQIQSLRDSWRAARPNLYPRVDGVANVLHARPHQQFFPPGPTWNSSWYLGLNVSWRLDGYFDTRSQTRELSAQADLLEAQRRQAAEAIELEIRSAFEEWQRAQRSIVLGRSENRSTQAVYEQRLALFRAGEATSTDVSEAETSRHNALLQEVLARIHSRMASVRYAHAAGYGVR